MLRRNATSPWLFVALLCLTALASAQTTARPVALTGPTEDNPGIVAPGKAPPVPLAEPQRAPANILDDGPRDVGNKVDPTICNSRPLPDDVMAQCRRWLLIASACAHAATHPGNPDSTSSRHAART
jgi:hypothetical protein